MRLLLVIALCLTGCSTSRPALPEQPNAPTSEGIVTTVGKQWDKADQKVAASISIAREMADKPEVVRGETTVALSFLPAPSPEELALARQRAAKADQKDYAQAIAFGKNLLATIDANWAKVEADNKEAIRVSQLKDARIVELTKEIEQGKKDLWTMAGVGCALLGAVAMVFSGPKVGVSLILSGSAIGAFPFVVDSPWFPWVAGAFAVTLAGIGIWVAYDAASDKVHESDKPDEQAPPKV